ncbi:MAG TPA: hypothetical protein VHQ47_11650 [Phycisphaerae bacterium]|nr:hypothetical protein [Phycisphaerae bacterium]
MKTGTTRGGRQAVALGAAAAMFAAVGLLPWRVLAVEPAGTQAATMGEQAKQAGRDFPYVVAFETGLRDLSGEDAIQITDVRGTSPQMDGGIYRITGTYRLSSRDSATLAASVTARDAKDGVGPWNKAQVTKVQKGEGTFNLLLPISIQGWAHVSFYDDHHSLGGVYVGTGNTVLHHY